MKLDLHEGTWKSSAAIQTHDSTAIIIVSCRSLKTQLGYVPKKLDIWLS